MEKYVLINPNSFNMKHIFECGQCFRWNKQEDNSYIGVVKNAVIKVKKENDNIVFTGSCNGENFEELIKDYFDLNTNYEEYKNKLSQIDEYMKKSIQFGNGIRILNQDLWECIISFIISDNNNIPRIKKIIERISEKYGKEIEFEGKIYYTFPDIQELSKASVQDLRELGMGFRDIRVYNTTHMILNNDINLDKIKNMKSTLQMKEELLKLDGVGPKVADCILLFSLKRLDAFPIDVWVRRVMNDLYIHNDDENKVNKKQLQLLAEEKFLGLAGIAQQYLFYWKREQEKNA